MENESYDQIEKLEQIVRLEDELEQKIKFFNKRMGYKWKVLIATFVFTLIMVFKVIIPRVHILFLSIKDAKVLNEKILQYIPKDMTINDIMPDNDLLMTAWDINNRSPRFFSKFSFGKYESKNVDHNLTLP